MARKKKEPLTAEELANSYRSSNIQRYPDGSYRWVYELNMYRNPTVLLTIIRVMAASFIIIAILLGTMLLFTEGLSGVWGMLQSLLFVTPIMLVLILLGYFFYCLIHSGKYIVLFEMSEDGLVHRQYDKQYKKAQIMGALQMLLGAASGDPGAVGRGILNNKKQVMTSSFSYVKKVKGSRRRHVIYINEPFSYNQAYVADEDYDFVFNYIASRCKKAKIKL